MDKYYRVFEGNRKWVEEKAKDSEFFAKLAAGQSPDFLYIGCADSRIPANDHHGSEDLGERVRPSQRRQLGREHRPERSLGDRVRRRASQGRPRSSSADTTVTRRSEGGDATSRPGVAERVAARGARSPSTDCIARSSTRSSDIEARYRRLVELNVQEQCIHVLKTASVQKNFLKRKHPTRARLGVRSRRRHTFAISRSRSTTSSKRSARSTDLDV